LSLLALDELTRRLRSECPWDREQDERWGGKGVSHAVASSGASTGEFEATSFTMVASAGDHRE
jgi:hypothetical protein